jgi:molybdate transport system ATP-binding protein
MSFDVDVTLKRGASRVAACFSTDVGLTALFGPSGVGKSSVLNMIAGILRPDHGRIVVGGEILFDSSTTIDVPPERRGAGYIFQDGRLFPHRRVHANLSYGARRAGSGGSVLSLDDAIALLGIGHLLDRWPATLSGGEAQRVAIGRALLSGPRFLLMDEPLAGLDRARRDDILPVIERIRDDLRLPILYVSHDAIEVSRLAARRIDMAD